MVMVGSNSMEDKAIRPVGSLTPKPRCQIQASFPYIFLATISIAFFFFFFFFFSFLFLLYLNLILCYTFIDYYCVTMLRRRQKSPNFLG